MLNEHPQSSETNQFLPTNLLKEWFQGLFGEKLSKSPKSKKKYTEIFFDQFDTIVVQILDVFVAMTCKIVKDKTMQHVNLMRKLTFLLTEGLQTYQDFNFAY